MTSARSSDFLSGVIEGFYGPPWSHEERVRLFDLLRAHGLNTYVYAPKDDLKHRALWRELYSAAEAAALGTLIRSARERGVQFRYALSPGLDLRYTDAADTAALRAKFAQLLALGCEQFALLFDDLPERGDPVSPAAAQCAIANTLFAWLRERCPAAQLAFCPAPYCGRMAARGLGGADYLATLGRELAPAIDVFWTGPEIISREITAAHLRELATVLRRRPLLWDNLHANDYDGRRFFCGPFSGRTPEIRTVARGVLLNPNCEFPLNVVPLHTLAAFLNSPGGDARAAYLAALRAWWPSFAVVGAPLAWEDYVLFCDCFYLPHADGPTAATLFAELTAAVGAKPAPTVHAAVVRLRDFCARLADLRDRALFAALHRRTWELREELDLLERYLASPAAAVASDFHLPDTYRGGFVPRLQRLLLPQADGTFAPPP